MYGMVWEQKVEGVSREDGGSYSQRETANGTHHLHAEKHSQVGAECKLSWHIVGVRPVISETCRRDFHKGERHFFKVRRVAGKELGLIGEAMRIIYK